VDSLADSERTHQLLKRVSEGDDTAREQLLKMHRHYVRQIIDLRMAPDLRRRLDPSDVVQEAQLVSNRRLDDYIDRRPMPFRLWLRKTAIEQLIDMNRRHVGAQKRAVRREIPISDVSSMCIARSLFQVAPSTHLAAEEKAESIQRALVEMKENDQEILLLRHAEGLTNAEAAELLSIEPSTASKRYGRALIRLHTRLSNQDNT
jgi:RNA polymerase sigma-70 factor (ECF subfamily)